MATEVIAGPLRDWLSVHRGLLNNRFAAARRRYPRLDPDAVLALCRELLPPLAGDDAAGRSELLAAVYDLILLHAGRGLLAPAGGNGASSGVAVLLRRTFPLLAPILAARPRQLPGALSNAVENLGPQGEAFAERLVAVAAHLKQPEEVLDAGAVLAWRLGEARLRTEALTAGERLPGRAVLIALGLPDWPSEAAPLVLAGLKADGWRKPDRLLTPETLAGLAGAPPERLEALGKQLAARPHPESPEWILAARLGDFLGFDGCFDEPPRLLDPGDMGNRHRFWVRCGDAVFRIDADAFGCVCRADAGSDYSEKTAPKIPPLALAKDAVTLLARDDVVAFTRADSFRIRIVVPGTPPL